MGIDAPTQKPSYVRSRTLKQGFLVCGPKMTYFCVGIEIDLVIVYVVETDLMRYVPGFWSVTVYRRPIRLPASQRWLAGSITGSLLTVTKVSRGFDSLRTHFLCEKNGKKEEEASHQGKNRAMWEEEAKPLKHKNDAERNSDLWQK